MDRIWVPISSGKQHVNISGVELRTPRVYSCPTTVRNHRTCLLAVDGRSSASAHQRDQHHVTIPLEASSNYGGNREHVNPPDAIGPSPIVQKRPPSFPKSIQQGDLLTDSRLIDSIPAVISRDTSSTDYYTAVSEYHSSSSSQTKTEACLSKSSLSSTSLARSPILFGVLEKWSHKKSGSQDTLSVMQTMKSTDRMICTNVILVPDNIRQYSEENWNLDSINSLSEVEVETTESSQLHSENEMELSCNRTASFQNLAVNRESQTDERAPSPSHVEVDTSPSDRLTSPQEYSVTVGALENTEDSHRGDNHPMSSQRRTDHRLIYTPIFHLNIGSEGLHHTYENPLELSSDHSYLSNFTTDISPCKLSDTELSTELNANQCCIITRVSPTFAEALLTESLQNNVSTHADPTQSNSVKLKRASLSLIHPPERLLVLSNGGGSESSGESKLTWASVDSGVLNRGFQLIGDLLRSSSSEMYEDFLRMKHSETPDPTLERVEGIMQSRHEAFSSRSPSDNLLTLSTAKIPDPVLERVGSILQAKREAVDSTFPGDNPLTFSTAKSPDPVLERVEGIRQGKHKAFSSTSPSDNLLRFSTIKITPSLHYCSLGKRDPDLETGKSDPATTTKLIQCLKKMAEERVRFKHERLKLPDRSTQPWTVGTWRGS